MLYVTMLTLFPLEFCGDVNREETGVMGSYGIMPGWGFLSSYMMNEDRI